MYNLNNFTYLTGEIESVPVLSHSVHNEKFYQTSLSVQRSSGTLDYISVLFSERLFNPKNLSIGKRVAVLGQFRSYNRKSDKKLVLYVFANEIMEVYDNDTNEIKLLGYVCSMRDIRKTPSGKTILDATLAVHRPTGKSDYIPLIFWGRNAQCISLLDIGTFLEINGRIQSRDYSKRIDDITIETRTAYEVSVISIENIQKEMD